MVVAVRAGPAGKFFATEIFILWQQFAIAWHNLAIVWQDLAMVWQDLAIVWQEFANPKNLN